MDINGEILVTIKVVVGLDFIKIMSIVRVNMNHDLVKVRVILISDSGNTLTGVVHILFI